MVGSITFHGVSEGVIAQQRFVDTEAYRAARYRGELIVDKFASRRRFAGWAEWAQARLQVRPSFLPSDVRAATSVAALLQFGCFRSRLVIYREHCWLEMAF